MTKLSLSLFAADILQMKEDLQQIRSSGITSLHVDIMDGHFVPLFGFNTIWLKQIKKEYPISQDFHFMAYVTREMLKPYFALKPIGVTIHLEAGKKNENMEILQEIKNEGIQTGIAISPKSRCEEVLPYLDIVDEILVMSALPGREDSLFLEDTYNRIQCIKKLTERNNKKILLSADGGLDLSRGLSCIRCGIDRIIMGRAFFASSKKTEIIKTIVEG